MITIKWKSNLLNNVTQNNKSSNSIYLYYKYKYVKINFMCLLSHFSKWVWSCRESFWGEKEKKTFVVFLIALRILKLFQGVHLALKEEFLCAFPYCNKVRKILKLKKSVEHELLIFCLI